MEGRGRGVNCFSLLSYPIFWGQWFNNNYFGTDCTFVLILLVIINLLLYTFNHIFMERAGYKINFLLLNFFNKHY